MSVSCTIRPCCPEDEDQLLRLYHLSFSVIDGQDIEKTAEHFRTSIKKGKVLVAVEETRILGFAGLDRVSNIPLSLVDGSSFEEILNRELSYARRPELRHSLLTYLEHRKRSIGRGEIDIETYDNELVQSTFSVNLDDVYCQGLAVIPELQQNGVGTALVMERERFARNLGASALYVHCCCSGLSPRTHYKLDFLPILKMGPEYEDGSASLLFGKKLI